MVNIAFLKNKFIASLGKGALLNCLDKSKSMLDMVSFYISWVQIIK